MVEQLDIEAFVEGFAVRSLDDLRSDGVARAAYVDRFMGGEQGHSLRTWEAIVETARARRAAPR